MGFWTATQQVRQWSREIITSADWNERQAAGIMQAAISDFNCKDSQFNMGSEDAGVQDEQSAFSIDKQDESILAVSDLLGCKASSDCGAAYLEYWPSLRRSSLSPLSL